MSDRPPDAVADVERVLVVGPVPRAGALERTLERDGTPPRRVRTTAEALDVLAGEGAEEGDDHLGVDCVVVPFAPETGDDEGEQAESDSERLEALAASAPGVPILAALESGPPAADAERALSAGATDVLAADAPEAVVRARVTGALRAARTARLEREGAPGGRDEDRYRAILEAADYPVLVVEGDGAVDYATPALEAQWGYTPAELERRDLSRLVHPDDREATLAAFARVATGGLDASARERCRLRRADGSWHRCTVGFHNRAAEPTIGGIVVTITPAAAMGLADAFDRDVIADLAYPFLVTDAEWTITTANDAAERMLGRPAGGLAGTTLWERLPEAVRGTVFERLHEAVATGEVGTVRLPAGPFARSDDGVTARETSDSDRATAASEDVPDATADVARASDELEVDVHPLGEGVALYVRDPAVATRRADDRRRMLEAAVDALEDGVFVLEGRTVVLANPAAYEFADVDAPVGRDVAEALGASLAESVLERARSPIRRLDPIEATLAIGDDERHVAVSVARLQPTAATRSDLEDAGGEGNASDDGRDASDQGPDASDQAPDASDQAPDAGDDGGDGDASVRTLCVVRTDEPRVRLRYALETLRETSRALAAQPTREGVCRRLLSTLFEFGEATVGGVYLLEGETYRPVAATTQAGSLAGSLPAVPVGETVLDSVRGGQALASPEDGTFEAVRAHLGLRSEYVLAVPIGGRGAVVLAGAVPSVVENRVATEAIATTAGVVLERVERTAALDECERSQADLRERLERRREFETRRDRLVSAATRASTREAVERAACEGLVGLEGVSFVWVGGVEPGADAVDPRSFAGPHETYYERVVRSVGLDPSEPACRAAAERTVVVVDPAPAAGEWAEAALERGFRSSVGVPVRHGDVVYGALGLYADDPSAFDGRVPHRLDALGEVLGFVVHALETKTALLADGVTELELAAEAGDDPLAHLAERVGGRLRVATVVPAAESAHAVFLTVEAADPAAASGLNGVRSVRRRGAADDRPSFELVVSSPFAATLYDRAASLRWIDATGERTRYGVELPRRGDVREFVRAVGRVLPGADLLARRDRERAVRRPDDVRSILEDRLTDRQLRALEAAYHEGYFEWPRERTGEEVAATLGVSQPTFNRHFRAAERTVYDLLFEEPSDE